MKTALLLILALMTGACSSPNDKKITPPRFKGGVDVGNMTSVMVPQTNASVSYPHHWSSSSSNNVLFVKNKSGSTIEAKKSEITDLISPTAISLQQYLKSKYPERDYKIINFNGFEGVRAELVDTAVSKSSDLYLVSELKDFIHIQSNLKKDDNGFTEGDNIILTVRVKYQGVPYQNAKVKTVTLESRTSEESRYRFAYSFWGDCYTYSDQGCNPSGGVAVTYERRFSVGASGYDHGRVVELGPEAQIPFDSIKIDGEYLVAPLSNTLISDIYTMFTPKNLQKDQGSIDLKEGYVYLVRTISWPGEDLITKMRVEKINGGDAATITYQKLVYVKEVELQKQIDLINKNTIENEMPNSNGEVTLYNRSIWGNYYYASFNFQYSTSGNIFITHNSWDFRFDHGCSGKLSFQSSHSGGEIGQAFDLGTKEINSVTQADFPDPNTYKRDCGVEVVKGHTYAIYHYDYGEENASAIFGAVQVLDIDPNKTWVRLKFRRIKFASADYFQKWIQLSVPQGIQTVDLEKTDNWLTTIFYPFINKRGDQGSHYYENMDFSAYSGNANYLTVDSRPYGNKRGFYKLGTNASLDSVTVADIEALKGKFDHSIEFNKGDVIAVLLENYYVRTVMVMRVEEHILNQSVKLSIKYLQRAKAPYSDDSE